MLFSSKQTVHSFRIMCGEKIKQADTVKYIGRCMEYKPSWNNQINLIKRNIASDCNVLFKLSRGASISMLSTLHVTIYLHPLCRILLWGSANQGKTAPTTHTAQPFFLRIYFSANMLNLSSICKLELAKLIYNIHHWILPSHFVERLQPVSYTHLTLPTTSRV